MTENQKFLTFLRKTLYNFASTFGLTQDDVKKMAEKLGFKNFSPQAYEALREQIQYEYAK
jgi:hypothetical protein